MKRILLIGTGGTIASTETNDGLAPALGCEALLSALPEVKRLCKIDSIQPINIDSTNIRPDHWLTLANVIETSYDTYDGFVITHGTDTMAYTTAALSYLIQNSIKPIVCTGAQIPMEQKNTDAARNFMDAFLYACDDDSHGVQIVFSGSVICGTRGRKNFSKRFDAFGSINFPELARIQDGKILRFVTDRYAGKPVFCHTFDTKVGILKLFPGMQRDVMRSLLSIYNGVVIESFGVGGIPDYSDLYEEIASAAERGKTVIMTTQVPNEGSDISLYRVGHNLKTSKNVLEAYDMTVEAAFTKLMWVLGQTKDSSVVRELFYKPIYHDILRVD